MFQTRTSQKNARRYLRGIDEIFAEKDMRILLKGQAKESYLKLKKRDDKDSESLLNSIQRIIKYFVV